MNHITFDLETLGNTTTAPIIQIGAVVFSKDHDDIIDEFYANIKWESLKKYNFSVDYSTIQWWIQQSEEARNSIVQEQTHSIDKALCEFTQWLEKVGGPSNFYYWTHATFDPPILVNAYRQCGKHCTIPFRLHRDIRTLNWITGRVEVERRGVSHNALDDAKHQALYIRKMLKLIDKKY